MTRDEHTSDRTSLGLVLQYLVEDALSDVGIAFKGNVNYYPSFIKPDVFIPGEKPKLSVHVTATGADDSFQMKRWRYIDEIMQMRSVFGSKFASVNLMFGPFEHFRESDKAVIGALFDYSLFVNRIPHGQAAFELCSHAVMQSTGAKKSREIATELSSNKTVARVMAKVGRELQLLVNQGAVSRIDPKVAKGLVDFLKDREKYLAANPPVMSGQAFWKRSLLRFLAVSPKYWSEIFNLGSKETSVNKLSSELLTQAVNADLITVREGTGSQRFASLTKEIGLTIRAGLSLEMINSVGNLAARDPRRKFELQDLWDGGGRAKAAVSEFSKALQDGETATVQLLTHSIEHGGSPNQRHHRAHIIDVALSALGLSQNRLQTLYRGPNFGVKNLIQNIVPRTLLCTEAILKKKIDSTDVAKAIYAAIEPNLSIIQAANSIELEYRYVAARRYNLTKGSSIDPLEDYVGSLLQTNGWTIKPPGLTRSHDLVGRVKTQFSFVAIRNGKTIVLKTLFGDSGADHKAEEMEARMRMVRLSTEADQVSSLVTVFVADGKWSSTNIKCLVLGGWDHIVTVSEFPELLKRLS